MSKLLTSEEWDVICFIEEQHLRTGKFPSLRLISQKTEVPQVKVSEALQKPLVQKALDARGIHWQPVEKDKLTAEQIACIQKLLDISDTRSIKARLADVGVTYSQYYGWKKQPYFMEAYREAAENLYGESLPEVHRSVIQEATSGSFPHQKLILAMTGVYDEKKSENLDVRYILMKVLEVIQIHVSDPKTLEAIAGEFETILNPNKTTTMAKAIESSSSVV